MKSFTFNRQLLLIMFMLLNCFTSYASDDNLITKQTIINLTEAGTLAYCSNLATIDIPSNVTKIGSSAFVNCSSLKSMNIPSSVKSIGGSAF